MNYGPQRDLTRAQTGLTGAQTENVNADTAVKRIMPGYYDALITQALASASLSNSNFALAIANIGKIGHENAEIDARTEGYNWQNTFHRYDLPRHQNAGKYQESNFFPTVLQPAIDAVMGRKP